MKKIIFLLFGLTAVLTSCEKVDQPLKPLASECTSCSADNSDPYITQKNILIEDFTGAACNNCPKAADEAKRLQGLYPDQIFVLGIHATDFAVPNPAQGYTADFRTTEGTDIFNSTGILGIPAGLVNRTDEGTTNYGKSYRNWESEVIDQLQVTTADVGIHTIVQLDTATDELCVTAKFKAINDLSLKTLRWAIFVSESKIIAPQKQPDNSKDPDYEHNHVLRVGLNGSFGGPVAQYGFTGDAGSTACTSRGIILDPNWIPENLEVLVYIYDNDTKEILQVVGDHL